VCVIGEDVVEEIMQFAERESLPLVSICLFDSKSKLEKRWKKRRKKSGVPGKSKMCPHTFLFYRDNIALFSCVQMNNHHQSFQVAIVVVV
jgi:hypothetical protein